MIEIYEDGNPLLNLSADEAFLHGSEEELGSILKEYWALGVKAIQVFRVSNTDFALRKARAEISEDRLST